MKCPWMKITKAYADYEDADYSGRPVQVVEEEFKECIDDECPFFGYNGDIILCYRAVKEVKGYDKE